MTDGGYTPDRIDRILRNFLHYLAVAETPSSSRQLLDPLRPGSTPNTPRSAKQKGHHSDPMLRTSSCTAPIRPRWSVIFRTSTTGWRKSTPAPKINAEI